MEFTIKNRVISRQDDAEAIGYNGDYVCTFDVDAEWAGKTITARFVDASKQIREVLLDDGRCIAPVMPSGYVSLGIYAADMTSTYIPVRYSASIKDVGGVTAPPAPDIYNQILGKVDETEAIAQSVRDDADAGLFKGEQGIQGIQGDKGDKGDKGEKGDKGDTYDDTELRAEIHNDYASAIKPTVSGASINLTDSADAPIQDLKVTPTDTSVTSVDITVCGKNVFSNTFLTSYEKFNVIIDSGNVTVTTTDATWYKGFTQIKKLNPNTTYTFSAVGVSMQNGGAFRVGIVDNGTNKYAKSTTVGERISYSFTTDASGDVTLMMGGNWDNSSSTTVYTNVQLEVGNLTAYEPYKEQTATIDTATQTGWENLKTYYPTTNIINTDSANMDCTYVADTKNYIDNKLLELTANMVDLATMQMLDN